MSLSWVRDQKPPAGSVRVNKKYIYIYIYIKKSWSWSWSWWSWWCHHRVPTCHGRAKCNRLATDFPSNSTRNTPPSEMFKYRNCRCAKLCARSFRPHICFASHTMTASNLDPEDRLLGGHLLTLALHGTQNNRFGSSLLHGSCDHDACQRS